MLESDLYDHNDSYFVVKWEITVEGNNAAKTSNKNIIFKNNTAFKSCISKINNTTMPMYNLLEYSDNYSIISGRLWNYFRDEITGDANENDAARIKINNNRTITRESFEYKTKLTGTTQNNKNILGTEVVVPLKYLSNFLRSLDLLLINCETEIALAWSKACIISEISITAAIVGNPRARPLIQAREARETTRHD